MVGDVPISVIPVCGREYPRGRKPSDSFRAQDGGKRGASMSPEVWDAEKRTTGRKRHTHVETEGRLARAIAHPADPQARDGALVVLDGLRRLYPRLRLIWADGAYLGKRLDALFAN